MTKLFKKMPNAERKSFRQEIRLTVKEDETIRKSAKIRNLSVSDFLRRAALGRRADVQYETQIVLALGDLIQSARDLNATMVERGFQPSEDLLCITQEAIAAMKRISK